MAATLVHVQNSVTVDELEKDEDESDKSDTDNCNEVPIEGNQAEEKAGSNSAHTDSENNANEKGILVKVNGNGNVCDDAQLVECEEKINFKEPLRNKPPCNGNIGVHSINRRKKKLQLPPPRSECDLSSSEESDPTKPSKHSNRESYPRIQMRRKTLLKIEKLTDSDSRNRDEMRSHGLSPPSSSDEENLYIGWVAYPTNTSKIRVQKITGLSRQRALCACVGALRCIISPVTKVCQFCKSRSNKVWDAESLKSKLTDESLSLNCDPTLQ